MCDLSQFQLIQTVTFSLPFLLLIENTLRTLQQNLKQTSFLQNG